MVRLARWESSGRKHWVELYRYPGQNGNPDWFGYRGRQCGGSLRTVNPVMQNSTAVRVMQARVNLGRFLPDAAVKPMRRVA